VQNNSDVIPKVSNDHQPEKVRYSSVGPLERRCKEVERSGGRIYVMVPSL